MALSPLSYLNGISGTIILLIGFFYGISFLVLYQKKKKSLLPIVSLLGFCAGLIFLGTTANFFTLLLTGENLSVNTYGLLSYTIIPVSTLIALYLGFHIFNPERKKIVTIVYSILLIIYWICLFFFTDAMFIENIHTESELLDISLNSVVLYLTLFYILSLLFVLSANFFILSGKMKRADPDSTAVKYLYFLGVGWALFASSSILDAIAPPTNAILIVLARILMITAYILIFQGFKGDHQ